MCDWHWEGPHAGNALGGGSATFGSSLGTGSGEGVLIGMLAVQEMMSSMINGVYVLGGRGH